MTGVTRDNQGLLRIETLRSRFGHLTANGKPRFAVSGYRFHVIRLVPSRLSYLFLFIRSLLFQLRNSLQSDVSMKNSSIIN